MAGEHATLTEVEAAVGKLSDTELLRLEKYAGLRARSLRALGLGWSGDDLLQEALMRTLDGKRKWKRGITFVKHLIGAMRSISSHLPEELKGGRPMSVDTKTGHDQTIGDTLVHDRSRTDDALAASEALAAISAHFADDHEVALLIEGLADGMKGPAIQDACGWSKTEYETIMRRLRRSVRREEEWRP